jgi:hypothetical protein
MKKVYIVLTYTGTLLSRIVKLYTRKEFSHVSISLDENLENMYSFGRENPYLILPAGFVREGVDFGTFKRFKKTKTAIYSLQITDEQFDNLKHEIEKFNQDKENYDFNIMGLFTAMFRWKLKREKKLYCAEFVKVVLDDAGVVTNLPKCVRPDDFKYIDGLKLVYTGKLKNYRI